MEGYVRDGTTLVWDGGEEPAGAEVVPRPARRRLGGAIGVETRTYVASPNAVVFDRPVFARTAEDLDLYVEQALEEMGCRERFLGLRDEYEKLDDALREATGFEGETCFRALEAPSNQAETRVLVGFRGADRVSAGEWYSSTL